MATLGSSAAQIAELPGWSTATVHVLHSHWAKEGDAIFGALAKNARGWDEAANARIFCSAFQPVLPHMICRKVTAYSTRSRRPAVSGSSKWRFHSRTLYLDGSKVLALAVSTSGLQPLR